MGGLGARLPFGGGGKSDEDDKDPATKSSSAKKDGDKDDSGGGGGLFGRFGGRATKSEAEATPVESKKPSGSKFGSRSAGGGIKPSAQSATKKDDDKKDEADEGGGIGGGIAAAMASIPFFGRGGGDADKDEKKPRSRTVKDRDKTPKVAKSAGLSLDRKLDILGVALVFFAFALIFNGLSTNQGMITAAISNLLGQLLGWGQFAVPITMLGVGVWLIIRHFGDEPPTIDTERLIGLGITYVGLLVMFQFIQSLNYQNVTTYADLEIQTRLSWEVLNNGGGWVGGNLYLLMVRYLGEVMALATNIFVIVVGVMFLLDLSISEIAIVAIGLWRSYRSAQRRSSQRKKVRRAERLAQRREQVEALAAPSPNIEVTAPRAEQLGAGAAGGALPAGDTRAIPITMGGRTVSTSLTGEAVQQKAAVPVGAQAQAAGDTARKRGGGLFGALPFGGGSDSDKPAPPPTSPPSGEAQATPVNNNGGRSGGLFGALPFGSGGNNGGKPPPTPENDQPKPTTATPLGTTQPPGDQAAPAGEVPPAAAPPANPFGGSAEATPTAPDNAATTPPPTAGTGEKASPFDAPFGRPTTNDNASGKGRERITDLMKQVNVDDEDEDDDEGASGGITRQQRLDAIRKGQAKPVLNQHTRPEDATPNSFAAATPQAEPPKPVNSNTDAYGNAPTSANVVKPHEAKPAPGTPPGAPTRTPAQRRDWNLPDVDDLLNEGSEQDFDRQFLVEQARIIEDTLKSFGAPGRVVEINTGPVITQYGVEPDYLQSRSGKKSRVKVSAIAQLDRDLQLALGARSIRVEAPVPGKGYVGIEIPNAETALVSLKDVMNAKQFQKSKSKSPLAIALGQSVDGTPISANLDSMPHLLIAGTTGSGKSVCVNSIICSMLAYNSPEDLRFIMVDPKRVELTGYNGIPHLVAPVVVELERIVGVLKWVTREMDERYKRFATAGARNIVDFNKHIAPGEERMPYIVVIIDELADLMMLAPEETERTITRIAALARATGIHLVIATQRPSVDVVTGLIKANFPARIAFAVAGSVDSRVILDQPGAERLLGRGDMLYLSGDSPAPARLQGVFVSDEEIDNITRYWKTQGATHAPPASSKMAPLSLDPATAPRQMTPSGVTGMAPSFASAPSASGGTSQPSFWEGAASPGSGDSADDASSDDLYDEAVELVRRQKKASVSMLQRKLRIGYTRASRLIDLMEHQGVIGPQESGSKPRDVLVE